MTYGADIYRKNTRAAATPIQIVIELYDEAVKRMEEALKAVHENRYEDRFNATERVRVILLGLVEALDRSTPEQAQLADSLQDFYSMVGQLLARTNVRNDAESCQQAIDSLRNMGDTWRELRKQTDSEQSTPPAEPVAKEDVSIAVSV